MDKANYNSFGCNVLVTGAAGFVGRVLVRRLAALNYRVTALVRVPEQANDFLGLPIRVVVCDLEQAQDLSQIMIGQDFIIHAAALLPGRGASEKDLERVNVEVVKDIIMALPRSLKKFLFISTVHVYGMNHPDQSLPIGEDVEQFPSTAYAQSKFRAEKIVSGADIPWIILRPAIVYGPDSRGGFLVNLINLVDKHRFIPLLNGGENKVHLVYIDDLVSGVIAAMECGTEKRSYVLAGSEPISVKELLRILATKMNRKIFIVPIPKFVSVFLRRVVILIDQFGSAQQRLIDALDVVAGNRSFDIVRARSELGYTPKIDYTNGVAMTLAENSCAWSVDEIRKLASNYETPFYAFNERILKNRYNTLRRALARHYSRVRIYYSAKTNFNLWVLRKLRAQGSDVEIACGQELLAALRAGFRADQVCFDGPVKTNEDLEYAIESGIAYFNFDSLVDAERANIIADRIGKRIRGGFRIDIGIKGIISGPAEIYIRKFGVPLNDALAIYREAHQRFVNIDFNTISCHIGSQIIKIKPYTIAVRRLAYLARDLTAAGLTIKEINLGGGFPSSTLKKTTILRFLLSFLGIDFTEKVPPLEKFGEEISRVFAESVKNLIPCPVLAIEPGRSLVSPMGILVMRAKILKREWVFVDGSKYFVPESAFFAQQRIESFPMVAASETAVYNIVGSSLNTADIFAMKTKIKRINPEDLVVVFDAGAYSLSRAIPFTVLLPAVYGIESNNIIKLVRRKGTYEDSLASDIE